MSNSKLAILLKVSIALIAVLGIIICALWYPYSVSLTQTTGFWTQLIFYWLTSIPCFSILVICWKIVGDFNSHKTVFVTDVSMKCILISKLLIIDIIVYLFGNVVFLIFDANTFFILYAGTALIGLIMAFVMYCIARFVKEGVDHRENSEGLI